MVPAMTLILPPPIANLDRESFAPFARPRLSPDPSALVFDVRRGRSLARGDAEMSPETAGFLARWAMLRQAAVLVGIVLRDPLTVLLTQRTEHLPSHAGQIAFPGGKIEPDDDGALGAALREAEEEIGLSHSYIHPLGYLDTMLTGTGFAITPVVATIEPGFTLTPDPSEVALAFEVPLAFLMDEANHQLHSRITERGERTFYTMPYENRKIWGATAGMLKNLYLRLIQR